MVERGLMVMRNVGLVEKRINVIILVIILGIKGKLILMRLRIYVH